MAAFLIPIDFSEASQNAALFAVRFFGARHNSFTFLHTYLEPAMVDPLVMGATPGLMEDLGRSMNDWIDRFRLSVGEEDLDLHQELGAGTLAGTVRELTEEGAYSAVVIGAGLEAGAVWSTSSAGEVVKVSRIPVLIVPPDARAGRIERLLVADDGGDARPLALKMVRDVARTHTASVIVLRVLPTGEADRSVNGSPLHHAMFGDVPHSFSVVHADDIAAAIDEQAVRNDVQLVAVLHRHVGLFAELFHRSMATRLATRTHVPLLVLEQ